MNEIKSFKIKKVFLYNSTLWKSYKLYSQILKIWESAKDSQEILFT